MIHFSPMSECEYKAYLDYFLEDYAQEIASNYDRSVDDARLQAETEIARSLPDGPQTQGQILLTILDNAPQPDLIGPVLIGPDLIGYVWYRPDEASRSVFIYDFYIVPDHRGKGQGKAALHALETDLASQGYGEIRLRVAADNPRAQHVYQTGGFRVTGINMAKRISKS